MKKRLIYIALFLLIPPMLLCNCKKNEPELIPGEQVETEQPADNAGAEPEDDGAEEPIQESDDISDGHNEIAEQLESVNNACDVYLRDNNENTELLSLFGFLYDDTNKKYIDIQELKNLGYLKRTFDNKDIMVLYIKPSDISGYKELRVKPGEDFGIFSAIETEDGVVIRNYYEEGGILPLNEFRKVILAYNQMHGDIVTPAKDGEEYGEILKGIGGYESSGSQYSVRYIKHDEMYAVVVASGEEDFSNVKQYLLKKDGNGWNVISGDLQLDSFYKREINKENPDFDINMLPPYDLYKYRDGLAHDKDAIIDAMLESGLMIEAADMPATYSCMADRFIYLEFTSGRKFLGYKNDSGIWDFYETKDYEESVRYMINLSGEKIVPAFILPM